MRWWREAVNDGAFTIDKVAEAIRALLTGWRAPKRHDHDEADAAEAKADAAVTAALTKSRAHLEG